MEIRWDLLSRQELYGAMGVRLHNLSCEEGGTFDAALALILTDPVSSLEHDSEFNLVDELLAPFGRCGH